MTVSATGQKAIQSLAVGAAASEYVAASGAVSSVVLGGGQQGDAAVFIGQLLDWLDGGVDAVATTYLVNPLRDVLGLSQTALSASARTPNLSGLSRNLKSGAGAGADSRTIAAVDTGAAVHAGGNISIIGEDRTDIVSTAGDGSAALVGVGAGVAVASANNDVQASLGAGASANAGGDIAIDAHFRGTSAPSASPYNVTAQAYGGSAGGLAGQASLSPAQAAPLLDAFAGADATLLAGGAIDAQTWYDFKEQSNTVGVTIGGVSGTAADSRVYASPESRARFEAGVSAHADGAVTVASHTTGRSSPRPSARR